MGFDAPFFRAHLSQFPLNVSWLYLRFCACLRVRLLFFRNEMTPPNPHEAVVSRGGPDYGKDNKDNRANASGSSNGGGGLEGGQDSATASAEDDDSAGMFANMFETAVGMAAEMAEQQLGLGGEDNGEESSGGEGEEGTAGNKGAELIGRGDADGSKREAGEGSSDEADAL